MHSICHFPLLTCSSKDIDYMDQSRDFTFDPLLFPRDQVKQLSDDLTARGMHYMLIIDPASMKSFGHVDVMLT